MEKDVNLISDKHNHLDYIQAAVSRMASNLFLLKGWSVTLIAALFALAAKDSNQAYAAMAYFPLIVFWTLDGYFLSQERRFRSLYDHVRKLDELKIDFSMDTKPFASNEGNHWFEAMFSRTLCIYYGSLAVLLLLLMWLVRN